MNIEAARAHIRRVADKAFNHAVWCETHDFPRSYLSDVLRGAKEPSDRLLAAAGLEKAPTTYRRIKPKSGENDG